jgi:RecG-like helicase
MTPVHLGETARERIRAMTSTSDGFRLAETDLRLRGPGEMAGTRQSGLPEFRVANLMEDAALLALAQQEARQFAGDTAAARRLIASLAARSSSVDPAALVNVG